MTVTKINELSNALARTIVLNATSKKAKRYLINYNIKGKLLDIPNALFTFRGIYCISLTKGKKSAVAYIGKSEDETDERLRHHLTGKNKNGTDLAASVRHKNKKIKEAISKGYIVHLYLYPNADFEKASLSCIEIASSLLAGDKFIKTFRDEEHWNERNG